MDTQALASTQVQQANLGTSHRIAGFRGQRRQVQGQGQSCGPFTPRLQVEGSGDPARVSSVHHAMQFHVQEDGVEAGLGHYQLPGLLIVAQARGQVHALEARGAVPVQEPFPEQSCRRKKREHCRWGHSPGEGCRGSERRTRGLRGGGRCSQRAAGLGEERRKGHRGRG